MLKPNQRTDGPAVHRAMRLFRSLRPSSAPTTPRSMSVPVKALFENFASEQAVAAIMARANDLSQDPDASIAQHLAWVTDALASAYTCDMANTAVSISIKFFVHGDDEQPKLHTLYRSTNTRDQREAYAPRNNFSFLENSAFEEIITRWPSQQSYAQDGLLEKMFSGHYKNSNTDWFNFYNSTVVAAIPQSKTSSALPVGFLCADSFANLAEANILESLSRAASHVYDVVGALLHHADKTPVFSGSGDEANLYLPCGWRFIEDRLIADNTDCQLDFERVLQSIEDELATKRLRSGSDLLSGSVPHAQEKQMGSKLSPLHGDEEAEWDGPEVKVHPPLTDERITEVLARMAPHNPDAAQILANRKS